MTFARLDEREQAKRDVREILDLYLTEAGVAVASGFLDALEDVYDRIRAYPLSGSPHLAESLSIEALRTWSLGRYPYVVFYLAGQGRVEVVRVLHGRRDIPAIFQEP